MLISHDHYDHLDTDTIDTLVRTQDACFVVPLGVGAHLARWGVPPNGSWSSTGSSPTRSAG